MEGNTHKYVAEEGSRDLFCRRAPHGARGLKLACGADRARCEGRAPHGARGLKHRTSGNASMPIASRPAWGAWIET